MNLVQAWLRARKSSFHHWEGAMRFVLACLSDSKHREREPVKHLEACISARKDQESSLHHCGDSVKLVQACLSGRKHRERCFNQRR